MVFFLSDLLLFACLTAWVMGIVIAVASLLSHHGSDSTPPQKARHGRPTAGFSFDTHVEYSVS